MSDFVTLEEAKRFIRIGSDGADAHVSQALDSAEAWVATMCSTSFATIVDAIQWHSGGGSYIQTPVLPIQSVFSLYDAIENANMNDGSDFELRGNKIFYTRPSGDVLYRWPNGTQRYRTVATVGYTGAGGSHPAPQGMKAPILMLTRRLYESGGSPMTVSTDDILDMLTPFKLRLV